MSLLPISGWGLWWKGVDVDPLAGGVEELDMAPPAQERVQHTHKLGPTYFLLYSFHKQKNI